MNTYPHITTPRTYRRTSAAAIARYGATAPQTARLAALGDAVETEIPFWDTRLIDRLTPPLSRTRE